MEPTVIITSPNSQFTKMAREVSSELKFETLIIEAVLDEALEKIQAAGRQYDVSAVISRGGTAVMLKEVLDIPVLAAEANDFDILTALLKAADISSQIAYVLSTDYSIDDLSLVTDKFAIEMIPYTFTNQADLSEAIGRAKRDGCGVVVSGSEKAFQISRQHGLACVLVNTSRRTMEELVRRAIMISEVRDHEIGHRQLLTSTLNLVPEMVFFLDAADKVQVVNNQGLKLLGLKNEGEIIGRNLSELMSSPVLERTISQRERKSGQVLDFHDKTMLFHSAPVFVKKEYLGLVLSLTPAAEVERMEHRLRRELHSSGLVAETTFKDMEAVTAAPAMLACLKRAKMFAKSDGTILITGESGVGKDLLAQSIHNASRRSQQPFVAINCAALPINLIESELFGYEEGAFTGAKRGGKPGYFELAHGGTIFLDELGLLPVHVQMQLLRVLQSRQVLRVGGRKMIPVDVRVVAATNADLEAAVAEGTFRQDLYYRVNVLHVEIPPLRERPEDLALLTAYYLPILNRDNHKKISELSDNLLNEFQNYGWPGNVRELVNYLTRLVVSSPGPELTPHDLTLSGIKLKRKKDFTLDIANVTNNDYTRSDDDNILIHPGSLDDMEDQLITWYMSKYRGMRSIICDKLGISRTTLWKKLKKMGLED